MFRKITSFLAVGLIILMQSCTGNDEKHLPEATGKLGSLVVVASTQVHNALKQDLDTVFLQPLPHLPAGEPFFDLLRPNPAEFDKFYYNHKTVLVLVDEASLGEMGDVLSPFTEETMHKHILDPSPVLMNKRNLYARFQHVVYLFGKDASDLKRKLYASRQQLISALMSYELSDQRDKLFKDSASGDRFFNQIRKELGLGVQIPAMFNLKYHKNGTYWFEYNATENQTPKNISLIVHAYPYRDSSDFTYTSIRTVRDTLCKYLIKGEIPGTYMGTTESRFYPEVFRDAYTMNGLYTVRVRGWWTIRGISMAGPFIRYVVHVPGQNKLFAFEGFVYKPNLNTKERDLRLIESIALTIKP